MVPTVEPNRSRFVLQVFCGIFLALTHCTEVVVRFLPHTVPLVHCVLLLPRQRLPRHVAHSNGEQGQAVVARHVPLRVSMTDRLVLAVDLQCFWLVQIPQHLSTCVTK